MLPNAKKTQCSTFKMRPVKLFWIPKLWIWKNMHPRKNTKISIDMFCALIFLKLLGKIAYLSKIIFFLHDYFTKSYQRNSYLLYSIFYCIQYLSIFNCIVGNRGLPWFMFFLLFWLWKLPEFFFLAQAFANLHGKRRQGKFIWKTRIYMLQTCKHDTAKLIFQKVLIF